jgi:DNA-binding response OmpR family regulator
MLRSQSDSRVNATLGSGRGIYPLSRRAEGRVSQTIFVLEDDPDINRLVRHQLERAGFAVRPYFTVGSIVEDAERARPSLFLLDVMVPGGDGMELCKRLRRHAALSSVPIIFLTARASENDRVRGLELGADDYITKPFGMRELLARVKAVLRRFEPATTEPLLPVIRFDEVEIDRSAMQLRVNGEAVPTTATEFRLLEYLVRHPSRVFTRDQLLDAVWGDARFVTPRSVDVYVGRIREKIEASPESPRYLKTLRGAGYRFELPKTREPEAEQETSEAGALS